jgi:hypothetical protein
MDEAVQSTRSVDLGRDLDLSGGGSHPDSDARIGHEGRKVYRWNSRNACADDHLFALMSSHSSTLSSAVIVAGKFSAMMQSAILVPG